MNSSRRMVYILFDHTRELIKIGFTVNFQQRFYQHKMNEKTDLEPIAIILNAGNAHESFLQSYLIINYKLKRYNNRKDWLTPSQNALDFLLTFDGSIFKPIQSVPTFILRGLTLDCLQHQTNDENIEQTLDRLDHLAAHRNLDIETFLEVIADSKVLLDDLDENGNPPKYVARTRYISDVTT